MFCLLASGLIALLVSTPPAAGAGAPRAPLAAALAQKKADRFVSGRYDGLAAEYSGSSTLKALPCSRLRKRSRHMAVEYVFHCSIAGLQECVFVEPGLSHAYSCSEPRPYRLANEDISPVPVVSWWYDEMPPRAFEPAGNGYLHPWCPGPVGVEILVKDKLEANGTRRLLSRAPFVFRPDTLRLMPWKCPLGPYEPVS